MVEYIEYLLAVVAMGVALKMAATWISELKSARAQKIALLTTHLAREAVLLAEAEYPHYPGLKKAEQALYRLIGELGQQGITLDIEVAKSKIRVAHVAMKLDKTSSYHERDPLGADK